MPADHLRAIHRTDAAPSILPGPLGSDPGVAGPLASDASPNPAASTTMFDRSLLWRFRAPERYQAGGPEATQRLRDALERGVGEWPLRVATLQRETVVSEVRSFERYVAMIWVVTPEGLVPVQELLL